MTGSRLKFEGDIYRNGRGIIHSSAIKLATLPAKREKGEGRPGKVNRTG